MAQKLVDTRNIVLNVVKSPGSKMLHVFLLSQIAACNHMRRSTNDGTVRRGQGTWNLKIHPFIESSLREPREFGRLGMDVPATSRKSLQG